MHGTRGLADVVETKGRAVAIRADGWDDAWDDEDAMTDSDRVDRTQFLENARWRERAERSEQMAARHWAKGLEEQRRRDEEVMAEGRRGEAKRAAEAALRRRNAVWALVGVLALAVVVLLLVVL
jgi:hypothetical protein